jgi:hypothetical protein
MGFKVGLRTLLVCRMMYRRAVVFLYVHKLSHKFTIYSSIQGSLQEVCIFEAPVGHFWDTLDTAYISNFQNKI